jgi:malate dehydrogenase (oxaloacetate-decarboxylating)
MEGKALLFKYLGDVDAFPICLNTRDAEEIIQVVKWMTPTFGGINLEDIESPKCYYIYERLSKELDVPVFHDDQQGTAIVTLAALINAMKLIGKSIHQSKISIVGAGTAAVSTVKHFIAFGVDAGKILMVNRGGILGTQRRDLNPWQAELARTTNEHNKVGDIKDAIKDADVVIGFSVPGTITKDMIRSMADDPIVFALSNPIPEIVPSQALEAGAKIVATGRSDYPNQVNNSLCFPAMFRGVLDVRAKKINEEMMQAATQEIARYAEEKGLRTEYIIPAMDETDMYTREAVAVANAAMKTGVARVKVNLKDLRESIDNRILKSRLLSKELQRLDRKELKFHALKTRSLYRKDE